MKECLNCGKELIGKQRKYCSTVCSNKNWEVENFEQRKIYTKEYREGNKEHIKEYGEQYHKENREELLRKKKEKYIENIDDIKRYNKDNKDRIDKYYQDNKERIKDRSKKYYEENREERLEFAKAYNKKNRSKITAYHKVWEETQPLYKLSRSISAGINTSLKYNGISKNRRRWEDLVGYTKEELRDHLESLFQSGMTWENKGEWHIDHIIPKSFFVYSSTEDTEFKYCWSLDNLQPLWAKDNLSKNDKILTKYLISGYS